MSDELFQELVSQFSEALPPQNGNDFSGTIGAIRLRSELKKEKQCGILDRFSLKCSILGEEVNEAVYLEKEILDLSALLIKNRDTNGDEIMFSWNKGKFANSLIYSPIKRLYILRYGKDEGERLDMAFIGTKEDSGVNLIIEYRRHKNSPKFDMTPTNFFIKKLYLQYPPISD